MAALVQGKSKRRREARQRPRHECAFRACRGLPDFTSVRGTEARLDEDGFAGREPGADARGARRAARQAGGKLWQQRSDFVAMHGDKCTRMNGVMTSDRAARQDRIDRREPAQGRNINGAAQPLGAITSRTCCGPQVRAKRLAIPPQQWTSDSHDCTLFRECRALNIFDVSNVSLSTSVAVCLTEQYAAVEFVGSHSRK
jgi:hypothetical protein